MKSSNELVPSKATPLTLKVGQSTDTQIISQSISLKVPIHLETEVKARTPSCEITVPIVLKVPIVMEIEVVQKSAKSKAENPPLTLAKASPESRLAIEPIAAVQPNISPTPDPPQSSAVKPNWSRFLRQLFLLNPIS